MARIAGDSRYYELALIDGAGNPKGRSIRVPSVTTILKALPKGGLDWWGFKLGVKGTISHARKVDVIDGDLDVITEQVYEALKKEREYTPNAQLGRAAGRGTDVHDVAELLFRKGYDALPDPETVAEEQRGYIRALVQFKTMLDEDYGKYEIVAIEEPLVSLFHGFAGTVDLILKLKVKGHTKPIYVLADFKTSKGIYESHLLQLPAYEQAAVEQGYIPQDATVWKWVVRLGVDGDYEVRESNCTISDFIHVKRVWEWLEAIKG